jgi:predicted  nucleic acid-binding Zn-ribbon protein
VTGPLDHLLAVQDLDTTVTQLQHRRQGLAAALGLTEIEAQLATFDAGRARAGARRSELAAAQAALEEQIAAITTRRDGLESRMYAATGSSSRDLQAMSDEVRHLTERRVELEDQELSAMLDQDAVDADLRSLDEQARPIEARADELRTQLAAQESEIEAALKEALDARASEAAQLPTSLADRYETLRARLKGTGAARLIGTRCDGCHLELSSVEVEKIRALPPDQVATCEQCGRILVPV